MRLRRTNDVGSRLQATERAAPRRRAAIEITRRFDASPKRVFDAWLDPRVAGRWLFATASRPLARVEIDPRVDGSFRFVERRRGETIEYRGEYTEITPPRRLVFTLGLQNGLPATSRVVVELAPLKNGCELRLTHEDVPRDCVTYIENRWTGVLYGLGAMLESGRGPLNDP